MRFKDISVAKKLWAIVLGSLLGVAVVSFGTQLYLQKLDAEILEGVQYSEERISLVLRWKALSELTIERQVIAGQAPDPTLVQRLLRGTADEMKAINAVKDQVAATLFSDEGKALFAEVEREAAKVTASATEVQKARDNGNLYEARRLVDEALSPAAAAYSKSLDNFVALSELRRDEAVALGAKQRQIGQWVGIGATLLVVGVMLVLAWLMVRALTGPLARAVALSERIAQGDLTASEPDDRGDELGHLLRAQTAMAAQLRDIVSQVRTGMDTVSSASGEVAAGSRDLSARTEQTAANLEQTAASMEELTATVTQSADTARQANQLASSAAQAAESGGQVMGQVVSSMQQITDSSRKISDIIGVIDSIAFQTNILALNAAVEAARAGEQGRGFAVVAGEVRALAQRSAEAAREIKQLIDTSVGNVEAGSGQVEQAGQNMQEIVTSVRRVTDLIGEITASSTEQSDGIAQVNQAVANLDQMTQQNAALVEQASAAASSMQEQAQHLSQMLSVFNVGRGGVPMGQLPPSGRPVAAVSAPSTPKPVAMAAPRPGLTASASQPTAASAQPKQPAAAPRPAAPRPAPTPTPAPAAVPADDDDWETF